MIYIAKHPILIACDSLCDSEMDERYLEDIHNDLKDALCSFINRNTKFNIWYTEVINTNLSDRLKGSQCVISIAVSYITEIIDFNRHMDYIKELDSREFVYFLRKECKRTYELLENCLDMETFEVIPCEYSTMEFRLSIDETF